MNTTENISNPYSKENFLSLKGYLVICVLIHHLYQYTGFLSQTTIGYPFYLLGHWAVIVFVFISGFGVYSSYLSKGSAYIKAFPRKRMLPFYIIYLFFVVIYVIAAIIRHTELTPALIIRSLTYGGSIVGYGWYFQLILVMYIMFWVLRRLIKNDSLFLALIGVAAAAFIGWFFFHYTAKAVYEPAFLFLIGILFANIYAKKPGFFLKRVWLNAMCGMAVFVGATIAGTLIEFRCGELFGTNRFLDMAHLLLMMAADLGLIVFVLALIAFFNKYVPVLANNKIIGFLGSLSLEIYALQSLIFGILCEVIINKTGNLVLFAVLAVFCVILLSIPLHFGINKFRQLRIFR